MKIIESFKKLFLHRIKIESRLSEIIPPQVEEVLESGVDQIQSWFTIGCSVIGNSHIVNNIPCQDSHFTGVLSDNWGIAVVSDGAGSHKNSHHGSSFMVGNVVSVIKTLVKNEPWFCEGTFPSPKEWRDIIKTAFSFVYDNLRKFGLENEMPLRTLGGTINLLVYSDKGYLSAHIGDGRAAVQFSDGSWAAAITPFKGEQAGETVFLTTDYTWEEPSICIESKVIQKPIKSFALLTDGLENYCFYCNVKMENDKFCDPNKPFESFFNQNIKSILTMYNNGIKHDEIKEKFSEYLKDGHPKISQESDDKTIVFGIKL